VREKLEKRLETLKAQHAQLVQHDAQLSREQAETRLKIAQHEGAIIELVALLQAKDAEPEPNPAEEFEPVIEAQGTEGDEA
jgi:hypothetical protein